MGTVGSIEQVEQGLQELIDGRKSMQDQLASKDEEILVLAQEVANLKRDIEPLEVFRDIVAKPEKCVTIYIRSAAAINLLRGFIVKAFGKRYDPRSAEDQEEASKVARRSRDNIVEGMCVWVCKHKAREFLNWYN